MRYMQQSHQRKSMGKLILLMDNLVTKGANATYCAKGVWEKLQHPWMSSSLPTLRSLINHLYQMMALRITQMKNVEIYTTPICGFCSAAKRLLYSKNVSFVEINVMVNSNSRTEMIKRANGSRTVPQIFIGNKHIGGCDELHALENAGKLDAMLTD